MTIHLYCSNRDCQVDEIRAEIDDGAAILASRYWNCPVCRRSLSVSKPPDWDSPPFDPDDLGSGGHWDGRCTVLYCGKPAVIGTLCQEHADAPSEGLKEIDRILEEGKKP